MSTFGGLFFFKHTIQDCLHKKNVTVCIAFQIFYVSLRRPSPKVLHHASAAVFATCRSGWVGHIYNERRLSDALFFGSTNLANSNPFLTINELREKFLIAVLRASASLSYKGSHNLSIIGGAQPSFLLFNNF